MLWRPSAVHDSVSYPATIRQCPIQLKFNIADDRLDAETNGVGKELAQRCR